MSPTPWTLLFNFSRLSKAEINFYKFNSPVFISEINFTRGQIKEAGIAIYGKIFINKFTYDGKRRPVLESLFKCIRKCNMAIANIDKLQDANQEIKDDFLGQAYFVRAFCHFELMRLWGPMPYLRHVIGADDPWDIPRLSKYECLANIALDMDSSAVFFAKCDKMRRDPGPGLPGHLNDPDQARPNGVAAKAYKGRALLYAASPLNNDKGQKAWEDAAKANWEAIQIAEQYGYALLSAADYKKNFVGNAYSNEQLWAWNAGNKSWNSGDFQGIVAGVIGDSKSSWSGVCPTQNFVDKFETKWGDPLNTPEERAAAEAAGHYKEQDPFHGRRVVQPHPKTVIVQNPPARPLRSEELDRIYELPYQRAAHPSYRERIPALEPVRFSITSHRGCFGSCSFCALTHHQGRIVQSRSQESILREVKKLVGMKGFAGIISDVGGPTANMYSLSCPRWKCGACPDKLCSADCPSLNKDHSRQVELLRRIREVPGVKRVFISSGIRHDLIMADSSPYLEEICRHHVSGHLKIAPEHISRSVTECMNKPSREVLDSFRERFSAATRESGREQYLLPYLMSGHPGCTVGDMIELAQYLQEAHLYTEQVQDFTPTPMTVSTAMYYTGLDPFTLQPVHIPKGEEKRIQRAMLQYRDPRNYNLVWEGLRKAGSLELVGERKECL